MLAEYVMRQVRRPAVIKVCLDAGLVTAFGRAGSGYQPIFWPFPTLTEVLREYGS